MSTPTPPDNAAVDIRTAVSTDHILLANLGARTFHDAFSADNTAADMAAYLAQSFSPDRQAAELADPNTLFLVAEVRGKAGLPTAVGYAKLRAAPPPAPLPEGLAGTRPIELVRLYVLSNWIGRGAGSALMVACLESAVKLSHDTIWLGVWEHNARAITFYTKWGFITFGSHPFRLGKDLQTDYLMGRNLPDASNL